MLAGEPSSALSLWLPLCPLRLGGGGAGAIREDVVLSAMLSLSSIREGRIEEVPLFVLSSDGADARCDDLRASGGGGGFFDCDGGLSLVSGLGVGSRDGSLEACARASLMAPLGPGTGGSGLLNSPDARGFDASSTGLSGIGSLPSLEKSSNATICGPELDTDFPCR